MKRYDVVIVGGSCAGAAAGYLLAKAGKRVVIVDKAEFPRNKLCGGMLTEKTVGCLKEVYDDISFEEIIDETFNTYGIYHSGIGKICRYSSPSPSLYLVDREPFDHYFLQKAKSAGCAVFTGQNVVDVNGDGVLAESGERYDADYIIGADGCYSVVRKAMFPNGDRREAALAIEVDLDLQDLTCYDDTAGIFPKIYFGYVNYGYAWVFPRKGSAIVGICGLINANNNMRDLLVTFLKTVLKPHRDPAHLALRGFPIPFQNFLEKPAERNIFLLGDAAGLIDPVTGEGICFAVLSGKLAAEALCAAGDAADVYNALIRKKIHRPLKQGYFARHFLYYRGFHDYAMYKMKQNAKYCKYSFDLLSGEIDYLRYGVRVLRDRIKYKSE
ncbi:MAG TPA: geranylgeranyl reductase family protein [Thermodesulfovibrionales bacterium]|nr:geranylgeranyl reductase family protein [Thermodesulfovibrionales bacterium]